MNGAIGISVLAALTMAAPALADPVNVPLSLTGQGNTPYGAKHPTVREDTNGLGGLQREATETEDGRVIPADTQLA